MLVRIRIFLVILALTLGRRALCEVYLPLVSPVEEMPAGVGHIYWASETLIGTSDGVFQKLNGTWIQYLPGREIEVVGELPNGQWWAAGAGFVATSGHQALLEQDHFSGGCYGSDGLFLAGKRGVWRLHDGKLLLVQPLQSLDRLRLFLIEGNVCLFSNHSVSVWKHGRFEPQPIWQQLPFSDIVSVQWTPTGQQVLAMEGLFQLSPNGVNTVYRTSDGDSFLNGAISFWKCSQYTVLASFFNGLRAISEKNQILWELSLRELGGNPFSMLKTREGFLVGSSSGAVRVFSA